MLREEQFLELLIGTVDVGLDLVGQSTFFIDGLENVLVTVPCVINKSENKLVDVFLCEEVHLIGRRDIEDEYYELDGF